MGTVGLILGTHTPPAELASTAALGEAAGFDELWSPEDFFFGGGFSSAGTALAATEHIEVTVGPLSVVARHPALLAMETTTLSLAYPGRLRLSVATGAPAWLRQMGSMPASPLTAVAESVRMCRRLMRGETVADDGAVFASDDIQLAYPTEVAIDVAGVGPKMVSLAGRLGDGLVLAVASPVSYVTRALELARDSRLTAGRGLHKSTLFALYSVDQNGTRARTAVRSALAFYKGVSGATASTDAYGISDEVERLRAAGGAAAIEREMPETWVRDLAIAGDPDECAAAIRTYFDLGVDAVALLPFPTGQQQAVIELTGTEVLPLVRAPRG